MYSSTSSFNSLENPEITFSAELLNSCNSKSSLQSFVCMALVISWVLDRFEGMGLCFTSVMAVIWSAMQFSQNFFWQQSIELFLAQSSQENIYKIDYFSWLK